jgi:predicted AlkP superfamily pyrophosphatase or phosphodiesterase
LAADRFERNLVDKPVLPDYAGGCISNIVPALLDGAVESGSELGSWMPEAALDAGQVVLFVLDGLGWEQLQERRHLAPTLSALVGGPITSVSPSTTATALTSIATGLTPGVHGVVGYRVAVDHDVLNVLRWTTPQLGDARKRLSPAQFQPHPSFLAQRPRIVTKAEFATSGFSGAHLCDVRFRGYRTNAVLLLELRKALQDGEPFVYAYYDGIDKVSHEYGLREHFDAEVAYADRMVADILAFLPPDAALVITADHGQVDVGDNVLALHPEVLSHVSFQSGEGRFRWLHARPGRVPALAETVEAHHGDTGWVRTRDETIDEGWWGPRVTDAARSRLGDVALVAREAVSYIDEADTGPYELLGRHGSLTAAEMLVPLLVGVNR